MLHQLVHGLGSMINGPDIGYLLAGSLIGVVVGVIPGLSTVVILSIILVFVQNIDLVGALCLFLGAQCGSFYAASVSAILLNTPAHPEAFPITFDGYPMARNGGAGRALGISAASTAVGGILGCGVLLGFLQIFDLLPGLFHPPEYVALVTLAMLMVGTLGSDSIGKSVVAGGAGLLLASIGPSVITGQFRYTFGSVDLYGGISLVALALGVFSIPQMVMVFGTGTAVARQDMSGQEVTSVEPVEITAGFGRQFVGGVLETFRHWAVLLQSGIVGGVTGIIPGIGGFTGNFLSYGIAKETSRKKDLYGTGIPDGIIAPEGSSLAKEAGHMVPILGLGIPGGVAGALFIGALTIKGIKVGYGFTTTYPTTAYQILWVILLSGVIGTVAGALVGPQLAKVTKVPGPFLVPFIFALTVVGPFLTDVSFFSVWEMAVFGIVGLLLRRLRYPLSSFILGLVLGPTFESNIYLAHRVYPGASFLVHRPLADVIFLIAIAVLVSKGIELRRTSRRARAELDEQLAVIDDEETRTALIRQVEDRKSPYPVLTPFVTLALLGIGIYALLVGATAFDLATGMMPVIASLFMVVPTALMLPRDTRRFIRHLRVRAERASAPLPLDQLVAVPAGSPPGDLEPALNEPVLEAALEGELVKDPVAAPILERSWKKNGEYRRELIAIGWMFGLIIASWLIGFVWGVVIFMVAYCMISLKRNLPNLWHRLLFTVVSTAVMWAVTYEMLNLMHVTLTPLL